MMRVDEFFSTESGAVTVDWVVLTAALAGLGLATMAVVSGGIENLSDDTSQALTDVQLTSTFAAAAFSAPAAPTIGAYLGQGSSTYPGGSTVTNFYTMSDGTEWTQTVVTTNGVASEPVWKDGDGQVVEAPEGA
jgi:hypothetical protein